MSSTEAGRNEAIAGLTSSSADPSQEAAELLITPRFDATDWGWVIISIGMAIGAGIVFLPVQVGLVGIWVFLLSAIVGYPAMYLFQRLFINSLAASEVCTDYPGVIANYLGKNWGIILGLLYFLMLVIWICVYSTAITNDSASYLKTFGITEGLVSEHPLYPLALISILVLIASRGEEFLFKISTLMVLTKLGIVAFLGLAMVGLWNVSNVGQVPPPSVLAKDGVVTLPFTLTSILFIQTLSPMVCSYRKRETSPEIARRKSLRAMNIAFAILFVTVFFYAISFTLALGHDEAVRAFEQNVSALAIAAELFPPGIAVWLGVILNIFAVMTAFFGVYLGFHEASRGIVLNLLQRRLREDQIRHDWLDRGIQLFVVALTFAVIRLNVPVLHFTSISSPIFGLVGCLIPAWLVLKVPLLARYRNLSLIVVVLTGFLLIISPFLAFL
jgi:serine transporter